MKDQPSRSFKQTTKAKRCPYGIMMEDVECISHNGKPTEREREREREREKEKTNRNKIVKF